jgi:hypothetical protein
METWKECGWGACGERFEPVRRGNQRRRADGPRHEGAIYCSNACKQAAYRWRLHASRKTGSHTNTQGTVTCSPAHVENIEALATKIEHAGPVPDGPNCRWEGGDYGRCERRNRAALDAYFDRLDADAVINDFCAVCGSSDDLGDRQLPGHPMENDLLWLSSRASLMTGAAFRPIITTHGRCGHGLP